MTSKTNLSSESGSVITEFIIVFPTFLIICLFVIEIGLMWGDRHVIRLAAFEAARVMASGDLPEFDEKGVRYDDPCVAPKIAKQARAAAVRKIAAIAMPMHLFVAKVGRKVGAGDRRMNSGELSVSDWSDEASSSHRSSGPAARFLSRWPVAALSTRIECNFDSKLRVITVDLEFARVIQTPIVDRIMYYLYALNWLNSKVKKFGVTYDLDDHFMGISTEVFGSSRGQNMVARTAILEKILAEMPTAAWRIPMRVQVALPRDYVSEDAVFDGTKITYPRWEGMMVGAMKLEGDYRTWAKELSRSTGSLMTSRALP